MRLNVITLRGASANVDVPPDALVSQIRREAETCLRASLQACPLVCRTTLLDDASVVANVPQLVDGASVLVLPANRPALPSTPLDPTPAPDRRTIMRATGGDVDDIPPPPGANANAYNNVQAQLTQLLHQLVPGGIPGVGNLAAHLQVPPQQPQQQQPVPHHPGMAAHASPHRQANLAVSSTVLLDPAPETPLAQAVATLTEFGYSDARIRRALTAVFGVLELAIEWLVARDGAQTLDLPLQANEIRSWNMLVASRGGRGSSATAPSVPAASSSSSTAAASSPTAAPQQPHQQQQQQQQRPPTATLALSPQLLQQLVHMLNVDPSVVPRILSNPTVHASMANPRIMQAFAQITANPSLAEQMVNDPEVGPVLAELSSLVAPATSGTAATEQQQQQVPPPDDEDLD